MKLYIKNMVSFRCKIIAKTELERIGLHPTSVNLGVVEVMEIPTALQQKQLKENLKRSGLELLGDKKSILIDRIKTAVIQMIHYLDELPNVNYSDYISGKLGYDYTYLSNIFSEVKGTAIQHFIIVNKIEKVKELLLYDELNVSEISYKMHYSSVAHLSSQFKKITGLSPSFFKKLGQKRVDNLENIDRVHGQITAGNMFC